MALSTNVSDDRADYAFWLTLSRISTTGASEYKLNSKTVTYTAYNAALVSHNILVKAKNFLVFQGDVEAVASQSPRELSRLIEQISGSLELQAEYEKAKEAQERATENATFNFTKRRGIAGEIKQYKEQKSEADRFEALMQEKDELIRERVLTKLYHIDLGIEDNARSIVSKNKELSGLRQAQKAQEKEVEAARAEQAKVRTGVMQKEKSIKKAEKALENKVRCSSQFFILSYFNWIFCASETRVSSHRSPNHTFHPQTQQRRKIKGGFSENRKPTSS
jgi:structural maintenance of chromosome 1